MNGSPELFSGKSQGDIKMKITRIGEILALLTAALFLIAAVSSNLI